MIDIHTHILPDLDDGAKTTEEAAALLQALHEQGVRETVFTPHYYGKNRSVEQFLEKREKAFRSLAGSIPEGMKVRLGAEVRMTGVNDPTDEALCALAIEDSKCVLVEFPFFTKWSGHLLERVSEFAADTGYTPIVAHVERYEEVRKDPATLERLIETGCLLQVNARAFCDKKTRNFAFALLKHGMAHCVGTDAHDLARRAPDYEAAQKALGKAGYAKAWREMQTRMQRALDGKAVDTRYTPMKKLFGRYF